MSALLRKLTWAGLNDTITKLSRNRPSRLKSHLPKSNLQGVVTAYKSRTESNKAKNNADNIRQTTKIESIKRRVNMPLKCSFTGTKVVLQSRGLLNFVFKMKNEKRPFSMIGRPPPEAHQTLTVSRFSLKNSSIFTNAFFESLQVLPTIANLQSAVKNTGFWFFKQRVDARRGAVTSCDNRIGKKILLSGISTPRHARLPIPARPSFSGRKPSLETARTEARPLKNETPSFRPSSTSVCATTRLE